MATAERTARRRRHVAPKAEKSLKWPHRPGHEFLALKLLPSSIVVVDEIIRQCGVGTRADLIRQAVSIYLAAYRGEEVSLGHSNVAPASVTMTSGIVPAPTSDGRYIQINFHLDNESVSVLTKIMELQGGCSMGNVMRQALLFFTDVYYGLKPKLGVNGFYMRAHQGAAEG